MTYTYMDIDMCIYTFIYRYTDIFRDHTQGKADTGARNEGN